jgi:hypothetical protein
MTSAATKACTIIPMILLPREAPIFEFRNPLRQSRSLFSLGLHNCGRGHGISRSAMLLPLHLQGRHQSETVARSAKEDS